MAKLSSTARPSSRQSQDAPQDVPAATAPARATRSTRSQSREPSEQPPTPQQRGKGKGGASKKGAVARKKQNDLTTVQENAVLEEEQGVAELEEDHAADVDALAARRMSVGAMSGTTAKTSFSQEEIVTLDPDVMVDVLPNLAGASNDLAKLLVPADPKARPVVRKEIRKSDTKYNKLYNNRCAAIAIHKHSFGSTPYIQPSVVLRALLGVQNMRDVPQGPWRPDNIIYKINLAQMLRTVLVTLPDNSTLSRQGWDDIEDLEVHFGAGIAGSTFSPSAFRVCLSLLTQLAIIRATAYFTDPAFVPTRTIVETFYTDGDEGSPLFKHANVLHMADLDGDQQFAYTQDIQSRVDQLTDLFNDADPSSWQQSLDMARLQFTWDDFVEDVIQYHLERSQEIDRQVDANGGADKIMSALSAEVEQRVDARKAEEKRLSFSRPEGTPKKGFGKGGIRALKAREKILAANTLAPPATAPVAQMTRPDPGSPEQTAPPALGDDWVRLEDDGLFVPPEPPIQSTARSTLAALSGIQYMQRQNAAKGKARSFIDPQPGATRVSFDDDSQSQMMQYEVPGYQQATSQHLPYYESPRRSQAKRPYAQMADEQDDFDPTQDQGFETDTRDTAAADQRRRDLPPAPARAPQPRFSSIGAGVPTTSTLTPPSPARKRVRQNPGSTIPPPLPPLDPNDDRELPATGPSFMTQARTMARHQTIMNAKPQGPQNRTKWSEEEEEALVRYIATEGGDGISYATIKALDAGGENALARRSAEDLRFKARNLKQMFLTSRYPLPENFHFVVLDKKAMDRLRALSIPYEQESIRSRSLLAE